MAEYSRLAKGNFTATGSTAVINLPFQPDYVELWNYTNIKTPSANTVTRAWWDSGLLDGSNNSTMVELITSTSPTVLNFDIISNTSSNLGINSFYGGLALQYGPQQGHNLGAITDFSISKANPAVVTTVGNHNLQTGDVIIFQNLSQTSTTGMQQIAGIPFTVTRTGPTTFTINWNTNQSNYTAFNTATSTNNVGTYVKVLFPNLYFPNVAFISSLTLAATTTVKTANTHQFQVGQEVAFRIPTAWGTSQLNSLPNTVIPGSPIYGYVTSVTDFQTFVVNINSTNFTSFNSNQTFAGFSGEFFPQVVPAGDVNTGGVQISATSSLYPAPQYSYASKNDSSTINGPAILGAYVNNTSQGFTIGAGTAATNGTATLIASTNLIYWHAYKHDFANP